MRARNDVVVGAVVILAVVLLVAGTIWLKGSGLGRQEVQVRARFHEVGQLLEGNTVKLRGVPIGRVEDISLEESGTGVMVTMSINQNVTLPEDPVVVLAMESMFGDWQAEIFPRRSFPDYDYAEAPDPSVLPGYALPDITRLTAVADEIARNMATLSERFEIAFTEQTAQNVARAIQNIQQVSEQLTDLVGSQQRAIDEVADNLSQTTESLGQAAATIERTFAQIETAIQDDRLVRIMDNVDHTTAHADSLTEQLIEATAELRDVVAAADTALGSVGAIASAIEDGEGTLGRLLRDTTLYLGLRETSIEVQALLQDIRAHPRKYINLTIF